jgi:S-adenosylmethionine:tRNA ribosyltransferase-isomerase
MRTADFDYDLPPERIAQHPLEDRLQARMLVVDRGSGALEHRRVADLPQHLRRHDLLVVNDTRVIPARLFGRKPRTGGAVELLLVEETAPGVWEALYRASGRTRPGEELELAEGELRGRLEAVGEGGRVTLRLEGARPVLEVLDRHGVVPLPPYIRRTPEEQRSGSAPDGADRLHYQTVYAREPGAVAAPTAGLHLTEPLLAELAAGGVPCARVTLHVGLGTFKPVAVPDVEAHRMEAERYTVPAETAAQIRAARAAGGRVVAVGSTVVRALETAAAGDGAVAAGSGRTDIFIHPPYAFRAVDALLTNFHLPRSTLLMMVCAFAGRETVLAAYAEAVRREYRFYSYGDCMLIV